MPRAPRIEFAGAIYHVMNRGNHLEPIFKDDPDRSMFLQTLAEACRSAGWVAHSFVLMQNHYHLLLETVRPTLVKGMRVNGLTDGWSAYCLDKLSNLARPIGVYQGTGYVRFDPDYADKPHLQVGHPVVADNPKVVILFSQLGDEKYRFRKGPKCQYYVAVNNPTDQALKVTLKKGMDFPAFEFPDQTVDLPAGGFSVLREK